jgi:uncharacterized membrane protein YkgB
LGNKFGAFVPELNARGNLTVMGISLATISFLFYWQQFQVNSGL